MSLLLSRVCGRKPVSIRSSLWLLSNGYSSSSKLLQTPPCRIPMFYPCEEEDMVDVIFSYGRLDEVAKEKKVPMGLMKEMRTIGASHGWVATVKPDGRVSLQDDLNPVASETNPKRISLPPFGTLPGCQTQIVTNMAMSSSSPEEDEDCIVAFKFMGPQLSFCKPAQTNPEWVNIEIQTSGFYSSPVMFSKKDGMFRIPGSGGHLIGSWDLHNNHNNHYPMIQRLRFKNLPKLEQRQIELLDTCYRSEHLVESRITGETFLVKLYRRATIDDERRNLKTIAVMVFKLDEKGIAVHTKDIGDLVIYLSKAEPFTVRASSFPDLSENSIYLTDADDSHFHSFEPFFLSHPSESSWYPYHRTKLPYFIPPQIFPITVDLKFHLQIINSIT